jgi:hypothetical protein
LLGDYVRDEAREEERNAPRNPLFGARPPQPPRLVTPQNPWRVVAETILVDANTVRPVLPIRAVRGAAVAGRSRFRKGVITLDEDGFTLSGLGVTPVGWLGKIGLSGYIAWVVFLLAAIWVPNNLLTIDVMFWISGIGFCLGILGNALESGITELRRGSQEIRVFWENVLEAQFETNMRWAVILYRAPERKPGVPGPIAFLPINNLTPAVAGALWDAIETYAPGRTRSDGGVYRWTTGRKIAAFVLVGSMLVGILLLIRLII